MTDFALPEGTFFDIGLVHLLTTTTLDRLRELPAGRFEVRRFRPNGATRTLRWIGHTLAIGDEVRLHITEHCSRCVMTTLAQGDLPKDVGILRTAAKHNGVHVGLVEPDGPSQLHRVLAELQPHGCSRTGFPSTKPLPFPNLSRATDTSAAALLVSAIGKTKGGCHGTN